MSTVSLKNSKGDFRNLRNAYFKTFRFPKTRHVFLVNAGVWYNNLHSYRRDLSNTMFPLLERISRRHNIDVAWLYTTDQHFEGGGSYQTAVDAHTNTTGGHGASPNGTAPTHGFTCAPHTRTPQVTRRSIEDNVTAHYSTLPHISFDNITFSRFDAHITFMYTQVTRRVGVAERDCTHYCMQPCLFEPILFEIFKYLVTVV